MWQLLVIAVIFCVPCSVVADTPYSYCKDLNPQNSLSMEQIMGMWYGVEIINHVQDNEGVVDYNSCPVIHISETTHEMTTTEAQLRPGDYGYHNRKYWQEQAQQDAHFRHLRLNWVEGDSTEIDYSLRFNNSRRGFWISSRPTNSSSARPTGYNQFVGTVQVMKAVGNHLVLNFCQRLPDTLLFTITLSRLPNQLTRNDIQSIHSLLQRRGLNTASIRNVCRSSAHSLQASSGIIVLLFGVYMFAKRRN